MNLSEITIRQKNCHGIDNLKTLKFITKCTNIHKYKMC